jgi:hypothetical protein
LGKFVCPIKKLRQKKHFFQDKRKKEEIIVQKKRRRSNVFVQAGMFVVFVVFLSVRPAAGLLVFSVLKPNFVGNRGSLAFLKP